MHMTREEALGYKRALEEIDNKLSQLIMLHSKNQDDPLLFLRVHNDLVVHMHQALQDINDKLKVIEQNESFDDIGAMLDGILDAK